MATGRPVLHLNMSANAIFSVGQVAMSVKREVEVEVFVFWLTEHDNSGRRNEDVLLKKKKKKSLH
jgi:hypothetical protein